MAWISNLKCITAAELISQLAGGDSQVRCRWSWTLLTSPVAGPPVTPVEQIKNGCVYSVQIWLLYVSGIHQFRDGGLHSVMRPDTNAASFIVTVTWATSGRSTFPLCGNFFFFFFLWWELVTHTDTRTQVSKAFMVIHTEAINSKHHSAQNSHRGVRGSAASHGCSSSSLHHLFTD